MLQALPLYFFTFLLFFSTFEPKCDDASIIIVIFVNN